MSGNAARFDKIEYRHKFLHYEIRNLKTRRSGNRYDDWHWHNELELCYVKNGKVLYKTLSDEYLAKSGDVLFLNSGLIHSVNVGLVQEQAFMTVHLFEQEYISGGIGTAIDLKYVAPVISNTELNMIVFRAEDERAKRISALMEKNVILKRDKPEFWEIDLKSNVFEIWKIIFASVGENLKKDELSEIYSERLKIALDYIQKHYSEKITLEKLAEQIHTSTRECCRMFKKCLNTSPINYLLSVRVSNAAKQLWEEEKSIYEIAMDNGYASSSQFSHYFKKNYGITPMEYRRLIKGKKLKN